VPSPPSKLPVSLKVVESLAGKAAVDLKTIDKGGDSDQTVGLDILLSHKARKKSLDELDIRNIREATFTDMSFALQSRTRVVESLAGKAAVDLKTIDKGGDSDQTVGLDILLELVS
jgi:hypothetical protein